jgi:hypothetical protein
MDFKYIAANADGAGDGIGNAIATDNHEELSSITGKLDAAQKKIVEWAEKSGGEVVTSSGDECIIKIPVESYDPEMIEQIRGQYSVDSGHTLSVGAGDSMSEASKALIFSKISGKDKFVEYSPEIDQKISMDDEEIVEDPEMDDQLPEDQDSQEEDEPKEEADITVPADDMVDEHEDLVDTLESPSHEDDLEEAKDQKQELEQYKDIEESGKDTKIDNSDETVMEQAEISEDDLDQDPESKIKDVLSESDGEVSADDNSQEDTENNEEIPFEGEISDEDEVSDEDEDMSDDDHNAISNMIHSNLEEDGSSPAEDEASLDVIREDVVNALQAFKENKPYLEQHKQDNPKLYEATLMMIGSMIEMAKLHGLTPVEDSESMEAQDALPDADMIPDEEMEDEDNQKDFEQGFKKSEVVKLYSDLLKTVKAMEKLSKKK